MGTGGRTAWRAVLVALAVLLGAVLMGGTLPVFFRWAVRDDAAVARGAGAAYALHTAGAAAGVALAGRIRETLKRFANSMDGTTPLRP